VRLGTKYAEPTIEDGVTALARAGVARVVGIVLTPHESSLGSGEYFRRAAAATLGSEPPLALTPVPSWHRANGFARLLADRTADALAALGAGGHTRTAVFFTAHSLPLRAVAEGDPYPDQVAESASDVAALAHLDGEPGLTWGVAWQSAGRTAEPWIGPALLDEIHRVTNEGATAVLVCPVGFVSDHLEILYDLDIEAEQAARSAGVAFARTASLNDDPGFLGVLADVVQRATDPGGPAPAAGGPGTSSSGAVPAG
jgi:ferrochelatase